MLNKIPLFNSVRKCMGARVYGNYLTHYTQSHAQPHSSILEFIHFHRLCWRSCCWKSIDLLAWDQTHRQIKYTHTHLILSMSVFSHIFTHRRFSFKFFFLSLCCCCWCNKYLMLTPNRLKLVKFDDDEKQPIRTVNIFIRNIYFISHVRAITRMQGRRYCAMYVVQHRSLEMKRNFEEPLHRLFLSVFFLLIVLVLLCSLTEETKILTTATVVVASIISSFNTHIHARAQTHTVRET